MEINEHKSKMPLIIIGIIILVVTIAIFISKNLKTSRTYYIELKGESSITLYEHEPYVEPGYIGKDNKGNNLTNDVIVTDNINKDVIGNYKVIYTLEDVTKERIINIVKKPIGATNIHLYGDINVFLYVGEKYEEKGYEVIDTVDGDKLNNLVKVTNTVDTKKEGIYKITYTVTNSSGITTSKERTVIVMDRNLSLIPNTIELTNNNITINIYAHDELFSYLILPNNEKVTSTVTTYEVNNNGTYKFIMYNKNGEIKEKTITIDNIDREIPNGRCTGYYQSGTSQITIYAEDNIGISKYVIDGTSYTTNIIKLNKEVSNVTITIYDKAGNTKDINCSLEDNNPPEPASTAKPSTAKPSTAKPSSSKPSEREPIAPPSDISYTFNTNTLKVWIKKESTYYVSHIWVKDAYHQLKTALPSSFGNTLEVPKTILTNAVTKNNLQNKAIIAVNASGFILNGTYGQAYYNANHAWDKTSESPIVIFEGTVLRDFASKTIPSKVTTYGLKANGDLAYYVYNKGTNLDSNLNTSKQIINDGVQYTTGFNPALVSNGQVLSSDTSPNIRQGFCQIDKNNFIFITNNSSNRSIGFSFKSMGELMVSLGCKTGVNLDGGGSTSLLTKDKNNNITVLYGNSRQIADILYFHE